MDLIKSLIKLEMKSIARSKCLMYAVLPFCFAIPFALFILGSNKHDYDTLLIFWTCILLALPVLAISPISFSKDGYFYQALMTRNIPLKAYVKGKILFVAICSLLYFVALTPFIIRYKSIVILTFYAGALYYITIVLMVILFNSSFDRHKIYLNGSPFFNLEGISIIKALLGFPIMLPLFFWDETIYWGIGSMFVVGFISLFLFSFSINLIAKNLTKRKYIFLNL